LFRVVPLCQEISLVAALSHDAKSGFFRILFRVGGKQYHKSLKTTDLKTAEAIKGRIEETLEGIERGWVTIPPHADLWQFLFSGGKREAKVAVPEVLTLKKLFDRYEEQLPAGSMEDNSLETNKLHRKHLLRILGDKQPVRALTTTDLQGYVNKRAKENYRGRPIGSATIKKEVATFRAIWNWALLNQLVTVNAPVRGLRYEKADEKLPFMTWAEIERRIERGGLSQQQIDELWDCLFLDSQQIAELLNYVKENAHSPYIYPMFVFVAHTGARRSEMLRSQVEDLDFTAGRVCLREKKRDRSVKLTFRHVEMSPLLREVMAGWLKDGHPGGPHTFCHGDVVTRSRKRSKTTGHKGEKTRATTLHGRLAEVHDRVERPGLEPLTRNEVTHAFKETLEDGKWKVVLGFHIFRHSLSSNAAARGVRQEVIDEWLGHQTPEMRKRYRHLFPEEKKNLIGSVFGV
jgi:integrase